MSLLDLLFVFVCRLSFGLAFALASVPHRTVISGFYRNHSYVLLGLSVLAALIELQSPLPLSRWMPTATAIASYLSSVAWLYEKRRLGRAMLIAVGILSMASGFHFSGVFAGDGTFNPWLFADFCLAAIVLGTTTGAMFLGHWYLNSPSMKIEPLRSLVSQMTGGLVLRAAFLGIAAIVFWQSVANLASLDLALFAMRWLCGIAAPLVIAWMAWQTLKIPNTQSATGILYVGVITVFLGELAALVLSSKLGHPL